MIDKRAYDRERMARRRTEAIASLGRACVLCGSAERLEIDHVDPAAKESHRIWSWSAERLAAELAKCRVLCRACHIERHRGDRAKPVVHGTLHAYKKAGCRCEKCRAVRNKRDRDIKRTKRQHQAEQRAAEHAKRTYAVACCRCLACKARRATEATSWRHSGNGARQVATVETSHA